MHAPVEYHFLEHPIDDVKLDDMLADGYFRTGNYLLKTRVLLYNQDIYNLFHIRYEMDKYDFPKSMKKLLRKNKEKFYSEIKRFKNTKEKEVLFWHHKERFVGSSTMSLEQYLFDYDETRKFNTHEINIYDKDTNELVAYSIFDIGKNSIASILGIFNKDYSKYSLGLYSMLLEVEYAKENNFTYYYPGYIADKPSPFNYKIRLGNDVDYYDWFSLTWKKLNNTDELYKMCDYYREQLGRAENWLQQHKIPYRKTKHPYYYMKYYYPQSNCLSSIEQLLIEDFTTPNTYIIVEYHAVFDKIVLSAVEPHYLEQQVNIDFNDILVDDVWQNLLLYIYPNYYIEDEYELLEVFLQTKYKLITHKNKKNNE